MVVDSSAVNEDAVSSDEEAFRREFGGAQRSYPRGRPAPILKHRPAATVWFSPKLRTARWSRWPEAKIAPSARTCRQRGVVDKYKQQWIDHLWDRAVEEERCALGEPTGVQLEPQPVSPDEDKS